MGRVKKSAGRAKPDLASFNALCPPELGPVAKKEWKRIVPELIERDLLQSLDMAVVSLYCSAYAEWLAASDAIQKYGAIIKTPSGYPVQSPYVAIANYQGSVMRRCADELCLSPASRIKHLQERKRTIWGDLEGGD
jgi:P27 family predicted phage terminase small subunit